MKTIKFQWKESLKMSVEDNLVTCPWCRMITNKINVHGHEQCEYCKANIDECCRGEVLEES